MEEERERERNRTRITSCTPRPLSFRYYTNVIGASSGYLARGGLNIRYAVRIIRILAQRVRDFRNWLSASFYLDTFHGGGRPARPHLTSPGESRNSR